MVNVNVASMLGACDRWLNPSVVMKRHISLPMLRSSLQIYASRFLSRSYFYHTFLTTILQSPSDLEMVSETDKYIKIMYSWWIYGFMMFDASFNNISVISWQSVLFMVEENGENHRSAASHWQTLSHNVVSSTPRLCWIRNHIISGDRYWLHR